MLTKRIGSVFASSSILACDISFIDPLPHLSISQILASFFNAEFAQPVFVFFDKFPHPVGIGLGVVPKCPANGLIDEKLGLIKIINQDLL